ncbi:MAG: amidohydrolase family protein, partial [Bacteroidetes bacterium]|nr:amidohydrolase family protein [Bacteroidota bacterium]
MKTLIHLITSLIFFFSLWISSCTEPDRLNSESASTIIKNVNVLTMLDPGILENQTVVVENGRVTQIGPSSEFKTIPGAKLINAEGKFLMPGLTEMHAHIPANDDEYVQEVLFLYLSNGVTTIRGMLGDPYHLELKRKVESNEVLSPRIYTSGPSLNGRSVTTVEDAVRMVREQKEAGYDFLKFHPGLKLEVFEALVSTANEVGIGFAGHVSTAVGIQ